jgi:hypothetical protein
VVGPTRRGLLAAAAAAGLGVAGCGAPEDDVPLDAELLAPSLAAAEALAAAYERAGGRIGGELAAREREHARRLREAGAAEAGPVGPIPSGAGPGGQQPLEAALALEHAAMRANVHATGLVRAPAARTLTAELLADAARHAVQVRERLGRETLTTAFPDGRDRA